MNMPTTQSTDGAAEAYQQICKLAEEHALILQAAGGVVTVVHPDTQRKEGVYCKCQYMAGKRKSMGPCVCKDSGQKGQCFSEQASQSGGG